MDSRQSRAQGRKVEEEKYVLQNQRNKFTESEKYIYKTRRIQVHHLRGEGGLDSRQSRAGKLRSRKIGEICCTKSEKYFSESEKFHL